MTSSNFKQRLLAGDRLYGTMLTLPCPSIAEILAGTGFDWLFLDGEHGPLETAETLAILQAVSQRIACLVRVPSASETSIKKVLDLGAHGVIVPQVNSAEQAEQIVQWCKYPPQGTRGVGLARAHGYGQAFSEYVENANDQTLVVIQAEHRDAVKNIDEITKVKGVDAILLGPYDLSASLNKTGQIRDPEVVQAIETICNASRKAGLPLGSFGVTPGAVHLDIERGVTLICAGTDSLFLGNSAAEMLAEIRPTLPADKSATQDD